MVAWMGSRRRRNVVARIRDFEAPSMWKITQIIVCRWLMALVVSRSTVVIWPTRTLRGEMPSPSLPRQFSTSSRPQYPRDIIGALLFNINRNNAAHPSARFIICLAVSQSTTLRPQHDDIV